MNNELKARVEEWNSFGHEQPDKFPVADRLVNDLSTALQEAEAENSMFGDRCIKQFEELQEQSDELNRLGTIIEEVRGFAELTPQGRAEWQVENDELKARLQVAVEALVAAGTSLNTISDQSGMNECMEDMLQVRGYANSRSRVAKESLAKINGGK